MNKRSLWMTSASFVMATAGAAAAQSAPKVNQGLMNLAQHIGIAYAQTRLSATSPPFPVQMADTTPFAAAASAGRGERAPGVQLGSNTGTSRNSDILSQVERYGRGPMR